MPVNQGMEKLKVGVQNCFMFLCVPVFFMLGNSTIWLWLSSLIFKKKICGLHEVQIISINLYFNIEFPCLCKLSTKSAPQSPSDRQVSILFIREETQQVR